MTEDANGTIWRIAYEKPNLPPLLSGSIVEAGGQKYLLVTVTRSASAPNTIFTLEVSSDLLTWASRPADFVTLTESPTQLVLRDNTPIQDVTARFIRLRFSTQ